MQPELGITSLVLQICSRSEPDLCESSNVVSRAVVAIGRLHQDMCVTVPWRFVDPCHSRALWVLFLGRSFARIALSIGAERSVLRASCWMDSHVVEAFYSLAPMAEHSGKIHSSRGLGLSEISKPKLDSHC